MLGLVYTSSRTLWGYDRIVGAMANLAIDQNRFGSTIQVQIASRESRGTA